MRMLYDNVGIDFILIPVSGRSDGLPPDAWSDLPDSADGAPAETSDPENEPTGDESHLSLYSLESRYPAAYFQRLGKS